MANDEQTEFPLECTIVSPGPAAVSSSPAKAKPTFTLLQSLKWILSFPAMLGTFFVGRLAYELRNFLVDPDLWWHIKLGQDIVRTHHWPTTDPYSFTVHGTPWIAYEWLGDVVIGFVAKFGLQALAAFLMAFAGIIAIALYYYASLCARNSKAGFVSAVLVCVFAVGNFNLRPQMFGALFLAVTLIVLELFRQGRPKSLWILPPMFLFWINAHGSWVVGLAVILVTLLGGLFEFRIGSVEGIRWTRQQRIQLELALLGSLAVIPITPYGTRLATYPFLIASSIPLGVQYVMEWFPMPFDIFWGKFFLALLVGALALQMIYQFKFRLQQWVLAIGGTVMTCLHVRFVLLFAPFFAPILAIMLSRWLDKYRPEKDKFLLNGVLMAAVIVAMVWYFPSRSELEHDVEKQFPVRAVNFLHNHPVPDPMFNSYGYGGYLVAYLPEHKVFIDGREDPYEFEGVMFDYMQATQLKLPAVAILRLYGIRTCFLERGEPLAIVLAELPDWHQIYADDKSVIFERTDSSNPTVASNAQLSSERSEHELPAD